MTATVVRADARNLPLPDASVDLIVCSPPFWQLRSYTDGGKHYDGQVGSEPAWQEYIANLLDCTREWARVLKPEGNLFVELGDKYAGSGGNGNSGLLTPKYKGNVEAAPPSRGKRWGFPAKCLLDLPHRYAIRCVDDLGLIKRAEIVWHHVNGLPESATDRVRRAHSMVFHFTRSPRYFSAVDEIRTSAVRTDVRKPAAAYLTGVAPGSNGHTGLGDRANHPLGSLPGSVWNIPSQPLQVPAWLGVDHFAAYPLELPRRVVLGWSPAGVCTGCGQGRRPVSVSERTFDGELIGPGSGGIFAGRIKRGTRNKGVGNWRFGSETAITGYACACTPYTDHPGNGEDNGPHGLPGLDPRAADGYPRAAENLNGRGETSLQNRPKTGPWREYHFDAWTPPPTRPSVVLDPFSGTGSTILVASVLGRHGIGTDLSADYCRLAAWRTTDPGERAKAMQVPKPPPVADGQEALFPA